MKVGDIVRLKSGSPEFTIVELQDGVALIAAWENGLVNAQLSVDALEKV